MTCCSVTKNPDNNSSGTAGATGFSDFHFFEILDLCITKRASKDPLVSTQPDFFFKFSKIISFRDFCISVYLYHLGFLAKSLNNTKRAIRDLLVSKRSNFLGLFSNLCGSHGLAPEGRKVRSRGPEGL